MSNGVETTSEIPIFLTMDDGTDIVERRGCVRQPVTLVNYQFDSLIQEAMATITKGEETVDRMLRFMSGVLTEQRSSRPLTDKLRKGPKDSPAN